VVDWYTYHMVLLLSPVAKHTTDISLIIWITVKSR